MEKAPTAFTFKTLLRHYAKRALTPRSLNVKLGPRRNYHEGRAAIRHYANQQMELFEALLLTPTTHQPQLLLLVLEELVQGGEEEAGEPLPQARLLGPPPAGRHLLQQHLHLAPGPDQVNLGGGELLPQEPATGNTFFKKHILMLIKNQMGGIFGYLYSRSNLSLGYYIF